MIDKVHNFNKTLITGGTGYIGSKLINFYIKNNHKFVVLTTSIDTKEKNYFYIKDLNNIPLEAFEGVDRVVHLAGISNDTNKTDYETKKKYTDANVKYVENVLNLSIKKQIRSFIFISSTKADDSNFKNFSDKKNLLSIYASTKSEAEKIIKNISKNEPIRVHILRPSIVYGPNAKGNLSLFVSLLKKGLKLKFYFLKNQKSLVHVDDVIRAINFLSINGLDGETYNLSGNNYELNQISEIISKIYKKRFITIRIPKFILDFVSLISFSKKGFFYRLKRDEIHSSEKIKKLGFNFSKSLYNIDQSDFSKHDHPLSKLKN